MSSAIRIARIITNFEARLVIGVMPESPEIFARIYARHGHRCPMSTLGGRLGLAAMQWLGDGAGELQAIYSNRTCATGWYRRNDRLQRSELARWLCRAMAVTP